MKEAKEAILRMLVAATPESAPGLAAAYNDLCRAELTEVEREAKGVDSLSALSALPDVESVAEIQAGLLNPATQVFFRAGLLACREYMARFVEPQNPNYRDVDKGKLVAVFGRGPWPAPANRMGRINRGRVRHGRLPM